MHAHLLLLSGLALASIAAASKAATLQPYYPRAAVQPLSVQQHADGILALRYSVPPESAHASAGVDYERIDGTLRVVITRCRIDARCTPMAASVIPLDAAWQAEVHLPHHDGPVVLVHADGEQPLLP